MNNINIGRDAANDWAFDIIKGMTNEELSAFLNAQSEDEAETIIVVNNIYPL